MDSKQTLGVGSVVLVVSVSFFILNQHVPRFADDFCRLTTSFDLFSILANVFSDYIEWTGRFPVMFVTRVILSLGDPGMLLFSISNALVLVVGCRLATHFVVPEAGHKTSVQLCVLICFLFMFWFFPHRIGEVALWKTGAIQYFWGSIIALCALTPVVDRVVLDRPVKWGVTPYVGWVLLCFIGGAWLENITVAIAATWFMLLLYRRFGQNRVIERHLVIGLIAWTLGMALLIIAPGNYVRVDVIGDQTGLIGKITPVSVHLYEYLSKGVLLIYVLFCVIALITRPADIRKRLVLSLVFATVGVLSIAATVGAPAASFVGRVAFPFEFFMIFAALSLFPVQLFTHTTGFRFQKSALVGLCGAFSLALAADYVVVLKMYRGVLEQEVARHRIIDEARDAGKTADLIMPALFFGERYDTIDGSVNTGRYFARDITPDPDHWRNTCYASAHDVESVRLGYDYSD